MKTVHWTMMNNSGMHNVAQTMMEAEKSLGIDSYLCDPFAKVDFSGIYDADIHIGHTHIPDNIRKLATKPYKRVSVIHGGFEHVFQTSVETGINGGYGAGDGFMLLQYLLLNSEAVVTFWPRHKWIYDRMMGKGRECDCIPLGVDLDFWKPVPSQGKYAGNPSMLSAENPHFCKWPLNLFLLWPYVFEEIPEARLHVIYMATDQHRWFFPLINMNGAHYASVVSPLVFAPEGLRNAFCSVDYLFASSWYGDHNRLSMEAGASGCKVISYPGNEYADYWVTEVDQRTQFSDLLKIFKGEAEPRKKLPVPSHLDMAKEMIKIYERVL